MADPLWLVSVHDVMPETMTVIRAVVRRLDEHGVSPLTLLVVPGGDWAETDIDWLRERQNRGDELAGHGWIHRAQAPKGLYDRLHRQFFSRGVAEHLPLTPEGIAALIQKCHGWFVSQDLVQPRVYVPPAWAMGRITRQTLRSLPFQHYESLSGIYDATQDRFDRIPLVGFEADTKFRALSLRVSNSINKVIAKMNGRLRVAIHPHDFELALRDDLAKLLSQSSTCVAYSMPQ